MHTAKDNVVDITTHLSIEEKLLREYRRDPEVRARYDEAARRLRVPVLHLLIEALEHELPKIEQRALGNMRRP